MVTAPTNGAAGIIPAVLHYYTRFVPGADSDGVVRFLLTAAAIGLEHNLGLTCDPVGGLVQIPCIERNAIASVKAITAARMAVRGDGTHHVSLDKAIKTLGLHPVRVVLHPEVAVQVTVNVAQSAEEAEMQAKGINPIQLAQKAAQGGGEDETPAAPAAKAEKKPAKAKKKADQDEGEGEAEAKTKTKAEAKPAAKDSGKAAKPKSEKRAPLLVATDFTTS